MPERDPGRTLAVDLDGTVVAINTFPSFVRHLARLLWRDRRLGALAALVGTGVLRRAHLARHRDLKRLVCRLGATVPDAELEGWARTVLEEHGHPEVVRLVRDWSGPSVLTTAAPEVYARHIGRLLDVDEVHGSTVRGRVLTNNESQEKCVRLRAAGLERVALFVTDDLVVDAPMASLADRVLEVRPGGSTRPVARR